MADYVIGQQIRLSAAFTTAAGVPVDPTAVTFKVRDGAGAAITYNAPTKDSVGNYHQDIALTDSGTWYYRVEGTGAAVGANETSFGVGQSVF